MRAWNCPCGWVNNHGPDCGYCGHKRPYTKDDLIADLRREIAELKAANPPQEERSDPLGLAAGDDNHKALVEAGSIIHELQHIHIGMLDHYQAATILERLVRKSQALAPFTTKETDHG